MLSADDVLKLQKEQYAHDKRNHGEIISLHKGERLKHYGLHFCKYVGRLARGGDDPKPTDRTIIDTALVCLSAANTLSQRLGERSTRFYQVDPLRPLADAAGRFADACEKFDHLEEFPSIARQANADIFSWVLTSCEERGLDLAVGLVERRKELAERAFFAQD